MAVASLQAGKGCCRGQGDRAWPDASLLTVSLVFILPTVSHVFVIGSVSCYENCVRAFSGSLHPLRSAVWPSLARLCVFGLSAAWEEKLETQHSYAQAAPSSAVSHSLGVVEPQEVSANSPCRYLLCLDL